MAMIHPYIINTINALILIAAGLIGYFINPAKPPTALLAPFSGILLLAATYHLRKHNRFVTHTVTALTLLIGILLITSINPESFTWDIRNVLLLVMGVSCFIAAVFYVGTFVKERRLNNNSIYKDDL
jgi:peptidoglycan/LPS O-acetylase OafA/YrhL